MKIYYEGCDYFKLFNPKTGEAIVDDDVCDYDANSLIGFWFVDEEHFNDKNLQQAWEAYTEKKIVKNDDHFNWNALHKFIKKYDAPDWIAYHINVSGYNSYTVLFVVEKDVVFKELNEDEDEMDENDHFIIT